LITVALVTFCAHPLFGGVVLDGSFGTHGSLPGPNFMIQANFGRQVGGNLFQSFSQFDLNTSQSAAFTGPNNIQNILARVTNGSPSSIDGTVNSTIPGANLFFLNPAGVMFGAHAQVNVSGSFAVSTANYLKLADGGKFNTSLGGRDVLTSAPVSSFGFLNPAPAPVYISGSNTIDAFGNIIPGPSLNVAAQKSFSVIAGNIAMNASTVTGPGSRVNLVSVKSPGEVHLDTTNLNSAVDLTQFTALGTINLADAALIDTSGPAGGPVVIRAGNFDLNSSQILSQTTGSFQGGAIDIAINGSMTITNNGEIVTRTFGTGDGGDVTVIADLLSIDGAGAGYPNHPTGIFATTGDMFLGGGVGNGGSITVQARNLKLSYGGMMSSSTFGDGDGGSTYRSMTCESV